MSVRNSSASFQSGTEASLGCCCKPALSLHQEASEPPPRGGVRGSRAQARNRLPKHGVSALLSQHVCLWANLPTSPSLLH